MSCEICGEDLKGLQYGIVGIDIETKGDLVQWIEVGDHVHIFIHRDCYEKVIESFNEAMTYS